MSNLSIVFSEKKTMIYNHLKYETTICRQEVYKILNGHSVDAYYRLADKLTGGGALCRRPIRRFSL
ncbi:hypothetical protein BMS3Bbin03_02703 [bacterium BMS3Bbin03]|nr:hypothetical protein BMS3Bbin03_02703 [bacterium BMS3Bbin03]